MALILIGRSSGVAPGGQNPGGMKTRLARRSLLACGAATTFPTNAISPPGRRVPTQGYDPSPELTRAIDRKAH